MFIPDCISYDYVKTNEDGTLTIDIKKYNQDRSIKKDDESIDFYKNKISIICSELYQVVAAMAKDITQKNILEILNQLSSLSDDPNKNWQSVLPFVDQIALFHIT